ncbi:hypothetical protein L3X38_044924 [Prunus dulcis]|uniref:Uncharacterized protein n=1 Tax=Prunus dulcis TaxID=3755 RepID=A0AAD4V0N5_PRUDU|nr:hypothetical protein L3X38_044924 [Prunus dulcis]
MSKEKERRRVVLEIIETVMKKSDALSGATDNLPPLMSNLKMEKKTDDPSGRQQEEEEEEEEQDSSEYAESLLGFLHEPTVDFVNKACDTEEERHRAMKSICRLVASLESEAARDLEEFEASIPENPQEWTQEMREYMYEKEKEEVRNFEEQQLVLEKKKRIQKRLDKTYRRRRKIVKKTSKRERESSSGLA